MKGSITNDQGETFTPNLVNGLHNLEDISDLIHVVLRNDLEADPYSAAMALIACSLAQAFEHKGAMSEAEYQNLMAIEETLRSRDPS